jgi:hypothetical protein
MKSLSKHLQESLNDENKTIVDIAGGNRESNLGLPESNLEETVVEEAKNEDVVTEEEATEKEKPSE